ncbi:uncharacterized protein BO80DRAFT_115544 [Aspergillus ibericus CBS 121593]|uniref:Ribonuclease H2 subunit B n=1 Tax=Aspergillus ibericus CBS 121593 TaxID=1448316 RepID=A0A395GW65_9EURO|nr:hypothetical protein BO80DRAFT_115544 [Aspergillus ibericus CBS 121593]RAK99776.1 hypothetical protein BO80DRAFT_115544 [Aspergillus ibericus CBS 121593]
MRTRRSAAPSEQPEPQSSSEQTSTPARAPTQTTPLKTFILPSSASSDARFLTLPNPRTNAPTRYFFSPNLGVYEFTVIASPPHTPRSTLFAPTKPNTNPQAHISKKAELLVATPIDILFFLVPLLSAPQKTKTLFQPLDDIIDSQDELPAHFRHVLYDDTFRATLHDRTAAICDFVEAGDEKMFRFNEMKLLTELVSKADRMVSMGLPPSLEERFVKQALATPLMAVKREDVAAGGENKENEAEGEAELEKKKAADESTTTEQVPEGLTAPDGVADLLRISTALAFMKECYLSKEMSARMDELLAAPETPRDFKPMRDHLDVVAKLRAEALASRSLGDFSRKRSAEDQEAAETRAEKKRRQEEEEKKKKAGESRGVRDLKKVNTTGMKKMSDFFGKAAVKKKT